MDALAAENAQLRVENAALRDEVAALRSQLAALGVGAAKGTSAGSSVDDTVPLLPPEIVLHVARFFEPGSRSLLKMMLVCKSFHDLLLPRFLEEFSVPVAFDPERALRRFWVGKDDAAKLAHVKKLDVRKPEAEWYAFNALIRACTNLNELSIAPPVTWSLGEYLRGPSLANLSRLNLFFDGIEGNTGGTANVNLPNLKHLDYTGMPYRTVVRAVIKGCPRLETIDCEMLELPEDCSAIFPEAFVSKIRTWRYCQSMLLRPMLRFRSFKPIKIAVSEFGDWSDSAEKDWPDVLRLLSLKNVEVLDCKSSLFLLGMPCTLESLDIRCLFFAELDSSDLDKISNVIRASGARFTLHLALPEDRITQKIQDELAFWKALRKSHGKLDLQYDEEEASYIEMWKPRVVPCVMLDSDSGSDDG
ncbi:hypothetical protein DFJ74DRAFT_206614 [Hyaloraphidium curvatum]|nr:hypothetical protein DFJ74DRAFT_206614 [Hyaloraphidium curvatum]